MKTGPFELKPLQTGPQLALITKGIQQDSATHLPKRDSLISPGIDNFLDSKYQDRAR